MISKRKVLLLDIYVQMIQINHNVYLIDVNKLFNYPLNIEWFYRNDEILYIHDTFQLKVELYFYYNVIF
jgi:hypothetical protein